MTYATVVYQNDYFCLRIQLRISKLENNIISLIVNSVYLWFYFGWLCQYWNDSR